MLTEAYGGRYDVLGTDTLIEFQIYEMEYINDKIKYDSCGNLERTITSEHPGSSDQYISIYTCNDDYLGFAYYPWSWNEGNSRQVIFAHPDTFPGGGYALYNRGMTVVHEMGHYLGLKHTFSRFQKCGIGDDGFTDTPYEKTPNYSCNLKRDTCDDEWGPDPVWNYMDYTIDECLTRFTPQQSEYVALAMELYRPKLKQKSIQNYQIKHQPTFKPTYVPSSQPTDQPSSQPTLYPTNYPSYYPTPIPTVDPTYKPTFLPSVYPTHFPTLKPTSQPSYSPSTSPTSRYQYCDVRKQNGQPHKNKCQSDPWNQYCVWNNHFVKCMPIEHQDPIEVFCDVRINGNYDIISKWKCFNLPGVKEQCKWHNHYIKCVPLVHTDPIDIYCDMRSNTNPSLPSKWKCLNLEQSEKCNWDVQLAKCVPKQEFVTQQPTYQPTYQPTSKPTLYPTNLPTSYPTNLPNSYPNIKVKGKGMGKGKGRHHKNKNKKNKLNKD